MPNIFRIKSISALHKMFGHTPPKHPAISFIPFSAMNITQALDVVGINADFYAISFKTKSGKLKYGRSYYDFEEGTMIFTAPNQIIQPAHLQNGIDDKEGWTLFFQPNLLYSSDLHKAMNKYAFFSYEVNEALHLSEKEKVKIKKCVNNIIEEYEQNLDQHSQCLIVSNLTLLLNYCKRFYDRQFYTRSTQNKDIVKKIEQLLTQYFNSSLPIEKGLPTVKYCAQQVNLSPNYLSDLLKKETGKNTKEHIDYYLLEKAKGLLLNTEMNINEIAFDVGFEYAKSFGKLFKRKMGITPKAFRNLN